MIDFVKKTNPDFWNGKKVLITGHTGFKGSWLAIWLLKMGAEVIGYSLAPNTERDNYVLSDLAHRMIDIRGDIRAETEVKEAFRQYQPEIVFHLAAQPLVRRSYEEPKITYETNVMGTLHVLEAIRQTDSVKIGIMVTTDKCYANKEVTGAYKEGDALGGYDPYSSSKACAEILIDSYRSSYMNPLDYEKHGKGIASVRAGNVIGGGDWSTDRILPDCIRALECKQVIQIRNPLSVRPWQHVLDALSGYLLLAERLYQEPTTYAEGWNFGPEEESFLNVWEVAKKIVHCYGSGDLVDASGKMEHHEARLLYLDIQKAKIRLGWKPHRSLDETIKMTVKWYKECSNRDGYALCIQDIERFEHSIMRKEI